MGACGGCFGLLIPDRLTLPCSFSMVHVRLQGDNARPLDVRGLQELQSVRSLGSVELCCSMQAGRLAKPWCHRCATDPIAVPQLLT